MYTPSRDIHELAIVGAHSPFLCLMFGCDVQLVKYSDQRAGVSCMRVPPDVI